MWTAAAAVRRTCDSCASPWTSCTRQQRASRLIRPRSFPHFASGAARPTRTSTRPETKRGHPRRRVATPRAPRPHHERIAMATLCRAYTSEEHAHAAVERLLSAGIAGPQAQVLQGETAHEAPDTRIRAYPGNTTAAREPPRTE